MTMLSLSLTDSIETPVVVNENQKKSSNWFCQSAFDIETDLDAPPKRVESLASKYRWKSRVDYIVVLIGCVGTWNMWTLPNRIYTNGEGAYFIPFIIVQLTFGFLFMTFETSLGQFSKKSVIEFYKIIPIMSGVGWTLFVLQCIYFGSIGMYMSWTYFYFFASFSVDIPWEKCYHPFNTVDCIEIYKLRRNNSIGGNLASYEYWEYYISGKSSLNDTNIDEVNFFLPNGFIFLALLFTWVIPYIFISFGYKKNISYFYVAFVIMLLSMVILTSLTLSLPGSFSGIIDMYQTSWHDVYSLRTISAAIMQTIYSLSIGLGIFINFGSLNDFRDNLIRDSMIICLFDAIVSIVCSIIFSSIMGYNRFIFGDNIDNLKTNLFFISFPTALSTVNATFLWLVIYFGFTICLGLTSQIAIIYSQWMTLTDSFNSIRNSVYRSLLLVILCNTPMFFLNIFFLAPKRKYLENIISNSLTFIVLPTVLIIQLITVFLLYGLKYYQNELYHITGYQFSKVFLAISAIYVTVLACLLYPGCQEITDDLIKTIILSVLLIFPIVFGIIFTIIRYYQQFNSLLWKDLIKMMIFPSKEWSIKQTKATPLKKKLVLNHVNIKMKNTRKISIKKDSADTFESST